MDDTIVPASYRTGTGDRGIPLILGVVFALAIPVLLVALGPFLWPWGVAGALVLGAVSSAALVRWWQARVTVVWRDGNLEFCRGARVKSLSLAAVERLTVNPALARTTLFVSGRAHRFSHRLVRVDGLLDALATLRPELFPKAQDRLILPTSWTVWAVYGFLALGTALAGLMLEPWNSWVGWAFEAAGLAVLVRALWAVPRGYVVEARKLTVRYWLRWRVLRHAWVLGQDTYTAGGVVFHRILLAVGRRTLVLDEGTLSRALRPHFTWIVGQLGVSAAD